MRHDYGPYETARMEAQEQAAAQAAAARHPGQAVAECPACREVQWVPAGSAEPATCRHCGNVWTDD